MRTARPPAQHLPWETQTRDVGPEQWEDSTPHTEWLPDPCPQLGSWLPLEFPEPQHEKDLLFRRAQGAPSHLPAAAAELGELGGQP